MKLLGVAIWIKTEDTYNGTCANVKQGEIFVGVDKLSSEEHQFLQRLIYKTHDKFPNEIPNTIFGYIADCDGVAKFVHRIEACKAENVKVSKSNEPIYSYNVDFEKELSPLYLKEIESMKNMVKTKYNVNNLVSTFYGD